MLELSSSSYFFFFPSQSNTYYQISGPKSTFFVKECYHIDVTIPLKKHFLRNFYKIEDIEFYIIKSLTNEYAHKCDTSHKLLESVSMS